MSEMIVDAKATTAEVSKEIKIAEVIVVPCEDVTPVINDEHCVNNLSTYTCSSNPRSISPNWRDPTHRELSPNWRKPPSKDRKSASPNRRNEVNGGARSPNWRNPSPNDGRALSPNWRKKSPKDLRSSSPNWRSSSNPSQRERSRSPRGRPGHPSGGDCAGDEDDVEALDSSNFDSVLTSVTPWLVMFSAPWCGPCRKLKPAFHLAANKLKGKVRFGLLNGDLEQNEDLVRSFASEGFPSLYHFPANGGTPEMYGGGRKSEEIVKWARAFILA